jgi:hypothetical protein
MLEFMQLMEKSGTENVFDKGKSVPSLLPSEKGKKKKTIGAM